MERIKWLRKGAVLFLTLLMVLALAGCGGGNNSKTVAFVSHDDRVNFTGQLCDQIEQGVQAQGMTLEFTNAHMDANTQIDQMNEVIAKKPAAIILLPVDADALKPLVEKANAEKIPVIVTNRDLAGGTYAQVQSDERQAGRIQGEYMAKNLKPGAKIVYFMGESRLQAAQQRWEGFKEACLDKRPNIELLTSADAGWSETEALKDMTLWLKLYPQIDAIVSGNDNMALGGVRAMKAAGRMNSDVLVTGVDAGPDAIKAVAAGDMSLTVKQDAAKTAETILSILQKILSSGQTTDDEKVPFIPITRDNVSQYQQ